MRRVERRVGKYMLRMFELGWILVGSVLRIEIDEVDVEVRKHKKSAAAVYMSFADHTCGACAQRFFFFSRSLVLVNVQKGAQSLSKSR